MIYSPSDAFIWLVVIAFAVLLIVLPIRWLMKLIIRTVRNRNLNARKTRFEKDLQAYLQDYEEGYITEEELDEIVRDYDSRDGRISVSLTRRRQKDE